MRKKVITIKDVANYCGVSIATVSRVLNNSESVKEATKAKVQKAMEELQYTPNRLAISLKNKCSKVIGLIVTDITNNAQMAIASEVEKCLSEEGYILIIMSSDDDAHKERKNIEVLNEQKVDGLVLTATGKNNDILLSIEKMGTPVVIIDRRPDTHELNYVGADKQTACYDGVKKLLDMGYRRIALVNGPKDIITSFERYNGYLRALYDYDIPYNNDYVLYGPFNEEFGGYALKKIWNMEHRPDVIVSGGEMITLGIMDTAKDLGINIPDDIGLLSFGNLAYSKLVVPSLAYIESFPGLVGRKAAEILLECLKNSNYSAKHISVKTEFRIGNSLRNINKTKQDAVAKKVN